MANSISNSHKESEQITVPGIQKFRVVVFTSLWNYRSIILVMILALIQTGCHTFSSMTHENYLQSNRLKQMAEDAEKQEEYHQAAEFWDKASRLSKEDASCSLRCAENYCKNENYRNASQVLKQALIEHPDNYQVYLELAEAQINSGNRNQANKTLVKLLKQKPNNVEAMMLLAKVAYLQKRFSYQGELYHRVLSAEPGYIPAQLALATWYMDQNKEEQSEILLRNIPSNPSATDQQVREAKWRIGILYGRKSQWNDAVVILSSIIDQKENLSSEDWYRLAYACFKNHKIPESREYLIKSLELNSSNQIALSLQKKLISGTGHSVELVSFQEVKASAPIPPPFWEMSAQKP